MTDKKRKALEELAKVYAASKMSEETFLNIVDGIFDDDNKPTLIPYYPTPPYYETTPWIKLKDSTEFTTQCTTTYAYNDEQNKTK